jgi:hypothetical protein
MSSLRPLFCHLLLRIRIYEYVGVVFMEQQMWPCECGEAPDEIMVSMAFQGRHYLTWQFTQDTTKSGYGKPCH